MRSAMSRPETSVAPVQEIMKLLRCGMPVMMYSRPLSPTRLPLMSRHCRKPMLLTMILQERGVMQLFLTSSSRIFLKQAIRGISRMMSSSLRFLLLSSAVLLVRVSFTFLHSYTSGQDSHSSGLQISESECLLHRLSSPAEADFTTRSTPSSRRGFSVRTSTSILSRNRMAFWKGRGRSAGALLSLCFYRILMSLGRDLLGSWEQFPSASWQSRGRLMRSALMWLKQNWFSHSWKARSSASTPLQNSLLMRAQLSLRERLASSTDCWFRLQFSMSADRAAKGTAW